MKQNFALLATGVLALSLLASPVPATAGPLMANDLAGLKMQLVPVSEVGYYGFGSHRYFRSQYGYRGDRSYRRHGDYLPRSHYGYRDHRRSYYGGYGRSYYGGHYRGYHGTQSRSYHGGYGGPYRYRY